jgi:methylated-DNA-protein-cysteine methyltransferase-like protein
VRRKAACKSHSSESSRLRSGILAAVAHLEVGEVVSYGDLASRAGNPRAARVAGAVLAKCPDTHPWWRVVYGSGHLPTCNPSLQAERLNAEGVTLQGFRVIASPLGRFSQAESSTIG